MMSGRRILALATGVLATLAVLAGPTSAGVMAPTNTVTIDKVVSGPVPAGTTFTVEVSCSLTIGKSVPVVTDVVFDSTGAVTSGNNVISTAASSECTATETVTGGASTVAYACTASGSRATCADPAPETPRVTFVDVTGSSGTITVTNTFVAPPAPPAPPAIAPLAVVVPPTFTG
jgi:hypothetical protein